MPRIDGIGAKRCLGLGLLKVMELVFEASHFRDVIVPAASRQTIFFPDGMVIFRMVENCCGPTRGNAVVNVEGLIGLGPTRHQWLLDFRQSTTLLNSRWMKPS